MNEGEICSSIYSALWCIKCGVVYSVYNAVVHCSKTSEIYGEIISFNYVFVIVYYWCRRNDSNYFKENDMFVKKTGIAVVGLAKEFATGLFNVIKWNDHNLNATTFIGYKDDFQNKN